MMAVETQVGKEDMLAGRLVVYSDLAQCFYYPAKPAMDLLKGEMEAHLPFFELVVLDLKPHLDEIKKWMQNYEEEGMAWLDLQKEYTRLFINAHPKVPAPPYGSLYLENKGMIWGETTIEAVKLYGEAGLKMDEKYKDIPDHFAAELEFMSYLIREEIKARGGFLPEDPSGTDTDRAEKMAALQVRFMKEHLGIWFESFLDKVIASTKLVFYREISLFAKKCIMQDRMMLLQ